jgi:tryptophan-rich sensory protein
VRSSVLWSGAFLALVAAYAVLSGRWVSAEPGWYAALAKPSFQPPDLVFAIIWPLNFLALAVAGVVVARHGTAAQATGSLVVFACSVVAALAWAYLFYVPHRLETAAAALAVAAVLTWLLLILDTRVTWWLGLLLAPYACWVTIATALAFGYARLNPQG